MTYLFFILIVSTLLFWLLYRLKIFTICPVCSATVLTWIIGAVLFYIGSPWANPLFIALLMGASLGALAEKLGDKFGFIWKTLWVIFGSGGIYFLLNKELSKAAPLLLAMLVITLLLNPVSPVSRSLKDKFKDCC